jgi:thiol-disulfide isomerase/thioredoxin
MADHAVESDRRRRSSSIWIATTVMLGMIIASGYYIYSRMPAPEPAKAAVEGLPGAVGVHRIPDDYPTMTIDGQVLRMAALRGKVVVLDFWATWCPPCRQEIPHLVRLSDKYRPRGLEIIGLSIEEAATESEKVRGFMQRFQINYKVGFASEGMFATYIGPGEQPIPQTLVFDRQGRLQAHFVGFDPKRDPPKLESLITRLL